MQHNITVLLLSARMVSTVQYSSVHFDLITQELLHLYQEPITGVMGSCQ